MVWPSSWPLAVPSATGKRCALSACTQSCLKLASLTLNRQGRGDEALCAAMPKIAQQDLNLESVVGRTIASHASWHKPSCTSCISDVLFCKTPLFQTRLSLQRGSGVRIAAPKVFLDCGISACGIRDVLSSDGIFYSSHFLQRDLF